MEDDSKKELNEMFSLNLAGKIFLGSLGAWMAGKFISTKIRGTQTEVNAVANALMASRRFQEELQKPGATFDSVIDKLRIKQMSASEFERVLGIRWPL